MKAIIEFYTPFHKDIVVVNRDFNDINHMNNFINYVCKKYKYTFCIISLTPLRRGFSLSNISTPMSICY
jgi:UDP-N-acetylglucosamine:LPS N-acetylglucosamine transferase